MSENGRPTIFTEDLADRFCARLAEGESMRSVCLSDDMPVRTTIFRWIRENESFRDQYARAKEESTTALFEELLDIADDGSNDWMESNHKDNPGYIANGEALQRSRLRVDVRKWALSKIAPKKYGDKVTQTHEVGDSLDNLLRDLSGTDTGLPDGDC